MSEVDQDHTLNDEKYKVVNTLLEEEYILVHVSTTAEGVVIPEYLKSDPSVTLRLSRKFVGKMEISKDIIRADLLFKGEYASCQLPLSAIWGVSTAKGLGRIWTECIPAGVAAGVPHAGTPSAAASSTAPLSAIPSAPSLAMAKEPSEPIKGTSARKRPVLKRVK